MIRSIDEKSSKIKSLFEDHKKEEIQTDRLKKPTVGVDPLLRQSIWNHLVEIVETQKITVIITTHYIEETRLAHKIGLIRAGRLLAEQSPSILLKLYRCEGLEDVFLKLCVEQQEKLFGDTVSSNFSLSGLVLNKNGKKHKKILGLISRSDTNDELPTEDMPSGFEKIKSQRWIGFRKFTTLSKMRALLVKSFLRLFRNFGLLFFIFAIPILQVNLFCIAIGHDPNGLKLAVVNHELNAKCDFTNGCSEISLSCRYLSYLDNYELEHFDDYNEALANAKEGNVWGILLFHKEYSSALNTRLRNPQSLTPKIINDSEIHVNLDMSNSQIGLINSRDLQEAYKSFIKKLLEDCGSNPRLGDIPVNFEDPIYGKQKPTFTDFVAPGIVLTIIFFLALTLTSTALIIEKTEGLLDRCYVAGVSLGEILLAELISQFVIMCIQVSLVLIFMFAAFEVTNKGSIFLVLFMTILQGFCGMCFGFFISAICDKERSAIQLSLGSFYPSLLLSGILWPIEGMPFILRKISICFPLTLATSSLRLILSRGWGLSYFDVYIGFVATLSWILVFLIITTISFRIKRY